MADKSQKIYFPSQRSSEEVFLLLRKHWFVYVPVFFIITFMSLPLLIAIVYWLYAPDIVGGVVGDSIIIIGGAYALFILSISLFVFVDYYLDVEIITNQRIVDIEQNGFFQRKISELSLDQVEDVSATVDGVFPTLLHYGDLHIQTAGSLPNFSFEAIPHPYRISKIILDLHDAASAATTKQQAAMLDEIRSSMGDVAGNTGMAGVPQVENDSFAPALTRMTVDPSKQGKILSGVADDKQKAADGSATISVGTLSDGTTTAPK